VGSRKTMGGYTVTGKNRVLGKARRVTNYDLCLIDRCIRSTLSTRSLYFFTKLAILCQRLGLTREKSLATRMYNFSQRRQTLDTTHPYNILHQKHLLNMRINRHHPLIKFRMITSHSFWVMRHARKNCRNPRINRNQENIRDLQAD
jgi:hypothetical protein